VLWGRRMRKTGQRKAERLVEEVEKLLSGRDFVGFLKTRVNGPLKIHHEFRFSVSDCPNACSRPQIVDIGIIGARRPAISGVPCTGCGACVAVCREEAIGLGGEGDAPEIDMDKCVQCGKCIDSCPSGALEQGSHGWRVLVGGKLGRHPQLGAELEGIYSGEEVLAKVGRCVDLYFEYSEGGERFGAMLNRIAALRYRRKGTNTESSS